MAESKTAMLVLLHACGSHVKGDIVTDAATITAIRGAAPPSFYVMTMGSAASATHEATAGDAP